MAVQNNVIVITARVLQTASYGICSPRVSTPLILLSQSRFGCFAGGTAPDKKTLFDERRWRTCNIPSMSKAIAKTLPNRLGDSHPAIPHPSVSNETNESPIPQAQTVHSIERCCNGSRSARSVRLPTAQLPSQIETATAIRSNRWPRFAQLVSTPLGGVTTLDQRISGSSSQTSMRRTGGLLFGSVKLKKKIE